MKRLVILMILMCCLYTGAFAQGCAICSKTAAGYGEKAAKGVNAGILYLAFIPLSILGTLGFIYWRYQKTNE
jgi:hypothetical protein